MDYVQNDIVDYELEDGSKTPALVVHVNDQDNGDNTVVLLVFHTDGTTERQVIVPVDEKKKAAETANLGAQVEAMAPEDREAFLAKFQSAAPAEESGAALTPGSSV